MKSKGRDFADITAKYLAMLVSILFGLLLIGVTASILYGLYKLVV